MKKTPIFLGMMLMAAALLALFDIFISPSSSDKAWFLGLSAQRLALASFPFTGFLVFMAAVVWIEIAPERYERIAAFLKKYSSGNTLLSAGLCFWAAVLLVAMFLYYQFAVAPHVPELADRLGVLFPTLCAYLDRLWPVLMFAVCCMACWTIYVVSSLKLHIFQHAGLLVNCGAGVFCAFAIIFQWVVFVFQLHVFEQIPGWYWPVILKADISSHASLFLLFLLFFAFILYRIRRFPDAFGVNLALIGLGLVGLEYALGFMEGRGLASLADRFFLSYHSIYTKEACNATISAREAVAGYEDLYPSMFLQTKPPGVLWMSFAVNQLANLPGLSSVLDRLAAAVTLSRFLPDLASVACRRSMALVTLVFPWLAASAVWVIYAFTRRFTAGKEFGQLACYSAILFVLCPNVVMLVLFLDQTFYPALFLAVAGGTLWAMRKKSFPACFLIGALLYGVLFLSFSMLPVLAVPVIYFACTLWQENKPASIWPSFKIGLLPMGLGGLLSMLLFKLFLNYDILTRYQHMMATRIEGDFYTRLDIASTGEATILEKLGQTWNAAVLNNIELAVAIGFPVFILFVLMGLYSLKQVIQRKPDAAAAVNASLFLSYVALNSMRVVLGEVARLWMFWIPVMVILAVQYLRLKFHRIHAVMCVLVVIQLVTVFITYQFQDYLMPQLLP